MEVDVTTRTVEVKTLITRQGLRHVATAPLGLQMSGHAFSYF